MESSIFRDLDGIVDSILSPYHTLEEVLPSGCDAGPVWMDFDCWVDSQKVDADIGITLTLEYMWYTRIR